MLGLAAQTAGAESGCKRLKTNSGCGRNKAGDYRSADQRLSKLPVRSAGWDPRMTGPVMDVSVDGEPNDETDAGGVAARRARADKGVDAVVID